MRWVVVVLAMLAVPMTAAAQTPVAEEHLPAAAVGESWQREISSGDPSKWAGTERVTSAAYFGPLGNRALVVVARVSPGPSATRQAWEAQLHSGFRLGHEL